MIVYTRKIGRKLIVFFDSNFLLHIVYIYAKT